MIKTISNFVFAFAELAACVARVVIGEFIRDVRQLLAVTLPPLGLQVHLLN